MTTEKNNDIETTTETSRRDFLKLSATSGTALAAGAALGLGGASSANADDFNPFQFEPSSPLGNRALKAAEINIRAANQQFRETLRLPTQFDNNDERRYASQNFYASYSKCLPCNQFGEVNPASFRQLQRAMRTGAEADFQAIVLDATSDRGLVSPQAAFKFELSGLDSHATRINAAHTFRSADIAGEMAEVYWQALTRDVPYSEYDSNPLTNAAVADLNNFTVTPASFNNGETTTNNLFRGETPGDLAGPYVSQLLLKDFSYGSVDVVQRYEKGVEGVNFMVDEANWLNVQKGATPNETLEFDPVKRYIFNARTMAEYVHRDLTFSAYLQAALVMLSYGPGAVEQNFPYINGGNQEGFATFGTPYILDLIARAGNLALTGAWFHKWRVNRFLRPEAYAGRVNFMTKGQRSYELHSDILNSDAVSRLMSENGTALCPQAFTEGSPTHPSFPAGHACYSGSCATVLKALFNEDFVIPDPVFADNTGENLLPYTGSDDLTLRGEINKLANNIALGRDGAGVHYRQDGVQGLLVGEQQAITLLRDASETVNEAQFGGFSLTKFDGTRILIRDRQVITL